MLSHVDSMMWAEETVVSLLLSQRDLVQITQRRVATLNKWQEHRGEIHAVFTYAE